MFKLTAASTLVTAIGLSHMTQAAPIVILYDSFEDPNILPSTSTTNNATGWFESAHPNTGGLVHVNHGTFTTPYGDQALTAWQGSQIGAQRNIGQNLEAGTQYAISFNVSKRDNRTNGDYRAELWAGSTYLDKVEGIVTTNDMSEVVTHTFDVSAGTFGDALQLRLIDPKDGEIVPQWQHGPYFDNVTLTKEAVPVPEPGSLALLGLGGLLIARRRRG